MSSASPAPGPGAWRSPTRLRPPAARWSSGAAMTPGCAAIATTRRSDRLPGVDLAQAVEATSDLAELGRCDAILVATPAQSSREMALRLARAPGSAPLVTCAKGIERGTHAFMTEVLARSRARATHGHSLRTLLRRRRCGRPADRGDARLGR